MKKILVTPLFGIGDTLMTTPALELLKKCSADEYRVDFFAFNRGTSAVMENNPNIDNLIYYPIKVSRFYKDIFYVIKNITFKYDISLNFYPSNRSAYNIFSALSGVRTRIGTRYLHSDFSQLNWIKNRTIPEDPSLHCVEENVRLLSFLGVDVDKTAIPTTKIFLTEKEVEYGKNYISGFSRSKCVGVHAGTSTFKGHVNRRWPKEKFLELVNSLPDILFFFFGTMDEIIVNNWIKDNSNTNNVIVVEGETLRNVAAIIKNLSAFVSNDSGLMHLANAVGTSIVAILGPTNPNYISPWKVKNRIVRTGIKCSPCFYYSPKPLKCELDGSFRCLGEIPVDLVIKSLSELIEE